MNRVEKLESEIQSLSDDELASFRAWFEEYDWKAWDRQLERDISEGKLDSLAEEAVADHKSGRTKPI